jgi:hypothetical protein
MTIKVTKIKIEILHKFYFFILHKFFFLLKGEIKKKLIDQKNKKNNKKNEYQN